MAATLISSAIPFEAPIARKRSFPVPEEPVAWPVERVTYKALRELCSVRGPWLTITGPAHRRGAANGEACVFIADILRDARAALAASPFSLFAERWIAPLEGLAEQWRGSESGFMWFISPYPEASGATVRAFEWQGGKIPRVVFSTYPEIAPLLEASSIPHDAIEPRAQNGVETTDVHR